MRSLYQDFKDLLSEFENAGVSYLLIGGYAVSYYSRPRYTKDLDLWIANDAENLERVYRALANFGAPSHVLKDLLELAPDEVLFMGNPPVRVDILQRVDGLNFQDSYTRRQSVLWHDTPVTILSREDLIVSKRAAGRPQDLIDATQLESVAENT